MMITLIRDTHLPDRTLGKIYIDGQAFCDTLEDPWQPSKVAGETRIPAGTYRLKLNTDGGMNVRYKERFPTFHRGMLEVCGVDDFTHVYLHIGNTPSDTEGCPLVGFGRTLSGAVSHSADAYIGLYNRIVDRVELSECEIVILDHPEIE